MRGVDLAKQRIIEARGKDVIPHAFPHTCVRDRCMPMSEIDLIDSGLLPANTVPINPSVYVCCMRGVHVCTEQDCEAHVHTADGVCPVSGICYERTNDTPGPRAGFIRMRKPLTRGGESSSVKRARVKEEEREDAEVDRLKRVKQTEERKEAAFGVLLAITGAVADDEEVEGGDDGDGGGGDKKESVQARPPSLIASRGTSSNLRSKQADVAEAIVTHIFYSDTRKTINKNKRAALDAQRDQEVANYYAARKGSTFPVLVEVAQIMASYDMQLPHMTILRRDDTVVHRFVSIILQTWDIVIATPWGANNPGYRFDAHALSMLYLLRSGMVIDGIQLIAVEPYTRYLPIRADLSAFGKRYSTGIVTNGTKNIKAAYASAFGTPEWPPDRFVVRLH